MNVRLTSFIFLVATLATLSCNRCLSPYSYNPPENLEDGLAVSTLQEVDLDTHLISEGVRHIACGDFNAVNGLLIYKDDKLVLEEYFPGYKYQWDAPGNVGKWTEWGPDSMHIIMSSTKSIMSTCIGIAVDKGYIKSVDESICNYLPNYQNFKNNGREKITIAHLVTMTAGLAWDEWSAEHGTTANDIDRIYIKCQDDPISCILERPLIHEPGQVFTYSGGNTILLGAILKNASGMDLGTFANKYLFGPLGIDKANWYQFNDGTFASDGSLYLVPRAMLKVGALYANNGTWEGERLLSEGWIKLSSTPYGNNNGINIPIEDSGKNGYGYGWWTSMMPYKNSKTPMYRANGWGGQCIMVLPELNMVVVFTGGNYHSNSKLFKLMEKYILPAAEGSN